jgi:hypothetical protein
VEKNGPLAQSELTAGRGQRSAVRRTLRADLGENGAQLVKVDRFGKMEIEASFFASPDIFFLVEPSEGYAFDRLLAFGLSNHVVAATVWQANVAQDDVELLRVNNRQRALRAIGHRNFVAKVNEQTRQSLQRLSVIFDNKNTQASARLVGSLCLFVAHLNPVAWASCTRIST